MTAAFTMEYVLSNLQLVGFSVPGQLDNAKFTTHIFCKAQTVVVL